MAIDYWLLVILIMLVNPPWCDRLYGGSGGRQDLHSPGSHHHSPQKLPPEQVGVFSVK